MLSSYACVVLFFFCCFVLDVWFYLSVHGQLMASPLVKQFCAGTTNYGSYRVGDTFCMMFHDIPHLRPIVLHRKS